MRTFQKQMQSGRSMIEMIGVISIMSLIMVGGLYGYRQALNAYRVNTLKNIVMQGKLTMETTRQGVTEQSIQTYAQKTALHCPSDTCAKMTRQTLNPRQKNEFHLFSQESAAVCEKLIEKMDEFKNLGITVTPNTAESCSGSEVRMDFSFAVAVRNTNRPE